ncbi:MAG: phosphodiesterase [Clostridiales bacterium]|nr:phosphodiesterase [Clostridiales bacterium]
MKLMFASDLHGSAFHCDKMIETFRKSKAGKLILLGDLLYHGPRNDLPKEYAPKEVISMLNGMKNDIIAIKGNCDATVDQMVLNFPLIECYSSIFIDKRVLYTTHGDVYNKENPLPMNKGDSLIYGHSHIFIAQEEENNYYINPGSVSLPKEGNPATYGIYEDGIFKVLDFEGSTLKRLELLQH